MVKAENNIGASGASLCATATTFCDHPWGEAVIYTNSTVAYGIVTIDGEPAEENDMVGVFVGEPVDDIQCAVVGDFDRSTYLDPAVPVVGVDDQDRRQWPRRHVPGLGAFSGGADQHVGAVETAPI